MVSIFPPLGNPTNAIRRMRNRRKKNANAIFETRMTLKDNSEEEGLPNAVSLRGSGRLQGSSP